MSTAICCLEPVLASYSIPRFRALQSVRRDCRVHLMALGAAEPMDNELGQDEEGFRYVEAVPGQPVTAIAPTLLATRVINWLEETDPAAVVITGYYYPAMRAAARWARRHRRLSVYMGDSQWVDRRRNLLKEWAKGWWVRRQYDAAFAAGERAAGYLQSLGVPRERIWTGYDVVDNESFAAGAATARGASSVLRARLGLPERFFLFVGRFAPEKNLLRLLHAYAQYRHTVGRHAWGLVLVGRGPLEPELRHRAEGIGGVVFAGFHRGPALYPYYGLASCLVLPSVSETWGLVVNEAMAAGLPVLVSHRCGCVPELVRQGWNGYLCEPLDIADMARGMAVFSSSGVDLDAMGAASRQIIGLYTPETWAQGLVDCLDRNTVRSRGSAMEHSWRWSSVRGTENQPG